MLPAPAPAHYSLLDPGVTEYALWHNVDRNAEPGVDETLDIFRYPFPWADNSFDGALCAHICEHIPHEIRINTGINSYGERDSEFNMSMARMMGSSDPAEMAELDRNRKWLSRRDELASLQDGWYAFFAELHRVLTPGSIIHVLSPYAWSQGGVTDPTHTRLLTEQSFTHSMQPDPNSPFAYATGGLNLEMVEPARFNFTQLAQPFMGSESELIYAMQTRVNMVYELYVKLRVVK